MCFSNVFHARLVDLMAPVAAFAAASFPLVAAPVVAALAAAVVAAPVVASAVVPAAAGLLTWLEWSCYHTIHAEGG